ncbi:TetR/AcrR family transcriptional regulator [Sphingomonas cavernae]|uniref:TetR/AcrR family transcriptional regulator n=1 Tax=Sphingomonas cavernae TaxID=2320861 RepID=A0A418WKR9_9SPHN|nr:TetR/AcrR family transcriptional regulator [Sphingomonas cavernae]RJF90605.1 TetR/AcrR family transcriptional regulator [Sphingomonas cavernae]
MKDGAIVNPTPQAVRRKRRSSEEITDRLIRAAEEEFKRCGYAGATTAAIARRADVTEAQLFRTFASKADLFREAVFRPLNAHFERFNAEHVADAPDGGASRDNARLYITELQRFIEEHAQLFRALILTQTYGADDTHGVGAIDSLATYFDRGAAIQSNRVGDDAKVDPRLMVRVSFAAVLANMMFKDWLFPEGLARDEEISSAIIDFVLDGINANSASAEKSGRAGAS